MLADKFGPLQRKIGASRATMHRHGLRVRNAMDGVAHLQALRTGHGGADHQETGLAGLVRVVEA